MINALRVRVENGAIVLGGEAEGWGSIKEDRRIVVELETIQRTRERGEVYRVTWRETQRKKDIENTREFPRIDHYLSIYI